VPVLVVGADADALVEAAGVAVAVGLLALGILQVIRFTA
jgi:hypothetical protein